MSAIHNQPSVCTICLEAFPQNKVSVVRTNLTVADLDLIQPDDRTPTQVKCQHVFHASCLQHWLNTFKTKTDAPSCPTCRTTLMDPFQQSPQSQASAINGMFVIVHQALGTEQENERRVVTVLPFDLLFMLENS
jgi:hypothetical protein